MNDPYVVLGVSRDASDRDIKKTYRQLSRKYHPDSYSEAGQKEWAEGKFREVQEAYNAIVNERSGKSSGYGYGGAGGTAGYSDEDNHLMAAMNYINAGKYNEAINVLNGISNRSARWYYLSSIANLGLGNNAVAMDYASRATNMDPGNQEFAQWYQRIQQGTASPYGNFGGSPFGGNPFGGGYGGGGSYGGYGNYGGGTGCNPCECCCDFWCLDSMCECMGGDCCSCM